MKTHPVYTRVRHKCIAGVLHAAAALAKITKGSRPKMLFSAAAPLVKQPCETEITDANETGVTLSKKSGEFRILTATDLHLETPGEELNRKSAAFLVRQIEELKPDLVIFQGDVIVSRYQHIDAVQLSMMMEKLGVRWCYIFGNHEAREEKEFYKYMLYKGLMYCPHCLNRFGDPSLFGYGNFAVNLVSGGRLVKSLFLFDSGRNIQQSRREEYGIPEEVSGYDFLKREQIEWYESEYSRIKEKYGDAGSFVYTHIPLYEYSYVFEGDEKNGYRPSGRAEILYGEQHESVACSPYNPGIFERGKKNCSLQAAFAGHDHINDFCAVYEGVYLVYTQCTGYNTYNLTEKLGRAEKDCQYGVTLTTVAPDGSFTVKVERNSKYL